MSCAKPVQHPLLVDLEVDHGFGVRGLPLPPGLVRPRQVHGNAVVTVDACSKTPTPEADVIVSARPEIPIAVVTADCVPILLAGAGGRAVAAVHAGWRGLARGIIAAAVEALSEIGVDPGDLVAVIGPCVGPCCYEVDTPVRDALARCFADTLSSASRATRRGHVQLDLGLLARTALAAAGVDPSCIGALEDACTSCDSQRFHSYRRDGPKAGRLFHYIQARSM